MRYDVELSRSKPEVATVTVTADDAAQARMRVEEMVREGKLPRGTRWQEKPVGGIMIGSPRRRDA